MDEFKRDWDEDQGAIKKHVSELAEEGKVHHQHVGDAVLATKIIHLQRAKGLIEDFADKYDRVIREDEEIQAEKRAAMRPGR